MDLSRRLDDALWIYRTEYKSLIGMYPYTLLYGKVCHLTVEFKHKAIWAMKKVKIDQNEVAVQRLNGLNDIDEFHMKAYERSTLYKEKVKKYMTK